MDIKASLENQITMLEKVQQKALEDGNIAKVEEISHSIMSLANMINSQK